MNKEEKEAIKELIDSSNLSLIGDGTMIVKNTTIATILNYIDKLQKENNKYIEEQNNVTIMETEYFKDKYISKENVRKFIKKYTKESLKNFSPYIINEGTPEQERKAGQLKILEKMRKELLGE